MVAALWIALPLVVFLTIPVNGLLIAATWAWFIVPIFDVRQISVTEAIGLSIFVFAILPGQPIPKSIPEPGLSQNAQLIKSALGAINHQLIRPLMALLFGWAWHTFFMPT
jgi:hypothetical protein